MESLDLLAHAGGWDEILMVGVPVLVFGSLLWLARRRALTLAEKLDGPADQK